MANWWRGNQSLRGGCFGVSCVAACRASIGSGVGREVTVKRTAGIVAAAAAAALSACAGDPVTRSFAPDADDGWATVRCVAKADGSVSDCQVVAESHPGLGFGAEAVRTASNFRLSARTTQGATQDAPFNVTVRFAMENGLPVKPSGD